MGFAPTWLRQVSPPPASQNHFNHWPSLRLLARPQSVAVLWPLPNYTALQPRRMSADNLPISSVKRQQVGAGWKLNGLALRVYSWTRKLVNCKSILVFPYISDRVCCRNCAMWALEICSVLKTCYCWWHLSV